MRIELGAQSGGAPNRPLMLCFSHLRWNFVYQRPQHLLGRAARQRDVIFFEEPIFADVPAPKLDFELTREGVRVAVPILPHGVKPEEAVRMQRVLVDALLAAQARPVDIAWYYTPMALSFSSHLDPGVTVYDNMDELSAFRGAPPEMIAMEKQLLQRADVVFTGGHSLYRAKRGRHHNLHPFPSSIDAAHFGRARSKAAKPLPDQDHLPGPRLGFFGVIDERMDVDLVRRLAEARPDWQLVMIGPVVKIDPATLPRLPNVHWLGPKDYCELPDHLAGWDVGIMPFAINESTRFISPTKTPEFLAAGLPVVSTAIEDVIRPYGELGLVEIEQDANGFIAAAERLLGRKSEKWLKDVDAYLGTTSWDNTWHSMLSLIEDARRNEPVPEKQAHAEVAFA